MSFFGTLVDAGTSAFNSDAGKLLQDAAAKRAASEINKHTGYGESADTQSPTAPIQPPTPAPAQAPAKASVLDAVWFWPTVGIGVVLLVVALSGMFKRKGG